MLNELKKLPETTIPEIGLIITNLEHSIKNLEESNYTIPDAPDLTYSSDHEVSKIIEEAREIVKKRLETELTVNDTERI